MKATLWGTRGSLASAGPDTVRYGGDTAAVEVRGPGGEILVLDAGSGIRPIGDLLLAGTTRLDILLTHLHMDHIQGLGFFAPLFAPTVEVHIWGPGSTTLSLGKRLTRYLSPPLFPVLLRDLPTVILHEIHPPVRFDIGSLSIQADLIVHPGPTLGYRIESADCVLAYLPDHEPALGVADFPDLPEWTSGFDLAREADVLIHDAQYTEDEYKQRIGWGHSTFEHALEFAGLAGAKRLVTFHHDPGHSDDMLDGVLGELRARGDLNFELIPGQVGLTLCVE
ncbi:MAG: MBL fold metallo-hydrolase [Acidimicrobiia bacterium]